jgi:hypothetical protein
MDNLTKQLSNTDTAIGNVYVMTHSLFSDVVRIGCTPDSAEEYAKTLSAKTPGEYTIVYSSTCNSACAVKERIKHSLSSKLYMNDFYEVSENEALSAVKREVMRIPSMDIH